MDPTIIPILNAQQQGMSSWAHGVNVLPEMAQANAQNLTLQMLSQKKAKTPPRFPKEKKGTETRGGNNVMENGIRKQRIRQRPATNAPAKTR